MTLDIKRTNTGALEAIASTCIQTQVKNVDIPRQREPDLYNSKQ